MAEYVGADAASLREQRKDHTTLDRLVREERRAREAGCRQKTYWKRLEHDPEKWVPVFGKDHAPARS
jgi:hypothetical protein